MSILKCTNPNYIRVDYNWSLSKKKHKPRVGFMSREEYLEFESTPLSRKFKTRCRKCLACKLYQGYEWSNRLIAEESKTEITYFLTFTYAPEYYDLDLINDTPLRDIQLFMKRLRKRFKDVNLKYYVVGELGGQTLRYHYHMILFSPVKLFQDKRFFKYFHDYPYYRSSFLEDIWGKGGVLFNYANANTIKYVANYVNTDDGHVLTRSYSRGLGRDYIVEHKGIDDVYFVNGNLSLAPRYLREKKVFDVKDSKHIKNIDSLELDFEKQSLLRDNLLNKKLIRKKT